ncbi:MAG: tyrosine-type recombinase/integrase [Lachnospiraceae bacterium]|nr:tyrosine-type recombinase/integrase [Lachnospiraceae bacterium]
MSKTEPIRKPGQLTEFKNYYLHTHPNPRNYAMIIFGLNTALRISDILKTTWEMVYDFDTHQYLEHLYLQEQKTGKSTVIPLNHAVIQALEPLRISKNGCQKEDYLFNSQKNRKHPICRCQAYRIIKKAAVDTKLPEHISCHSLRKTFGYYAWKNGTPPALIMDIFNHSSYQITKRYLCIEQDDKDEVFMGIYL